MRNFLVALSTAAITAAFEPVGPINSPYWLDWDNTVPDCWYHSPVACAIDEQPCDRGTVCYEDTCQGITDIHCEVGCQIGH